MRKFTNNRQKLTINRIRKGETPPKLQIEVRNGTAEFCWPLPLTNKDTNVSKLNNSSIFRKQNCGERQQSEKHHTQLIRCRSISTIVRKTRSKSKFIPLLPMTNQNSEEKSTLKSCSQEGTHELSRNLLLKLREKGAISLKNNYYTIHHKYLLDVITEIGDQFALQNSKQHQNVLENSKSVETQPQAKINQNFNLFHQYSIHQTFEKERKLTNHSRIIDQHQLYQQETIDKQTFWRIVEDYQHQKVKQQDLKFLLDKNKYLKQEIAQREGKIRQLSNKIEELSNILREKEEGIEGIQELITERSSYLRNIQQTAKEMQDFVNRQPNRILQQEAKEYKQRQQQLFDLAFLYQQQCPSSVRTFIDESIMIPFESFKLTIQSFPYDQVDTDDNYTVSHKSMDSFKASLKSAYESTIEKLSVIIEKAASKIKNFVGIMRRLASYTIGKRQYLSEINKKMAIASILIDKNFGILDKKLFDQGISEEGQKEVKELKQLVNNIKNIYCQAQVFY